jgi:hypothetical protein
MDTSILIRQPEWVERPLTEWECQVLSRLASLDAGGAEVVRESLTHLVVTGGCECGCASFNLRDVRFASQPHVLAHYSNGASSDGVSFGLWLGPDGRPISVDVGNEPGSMPDAESIIVSQPGS